MYENFVGKFSKNSGEMILKINCALILSKNDLKSIKR